MNILLTCAGRRNYIVDYFKIALKSTNGRVFTANSDSYAAAFVPADQSFLVPEVYHSDYTQILLRICKEYKVSAIVPLFDIELPVLAKSKNLFLSNGVEVVVSSPEVVNICYDKWETNKFLQENGFLVPKTFITLDAVKYALKSKEIDFPLIIKPRWGMGSIGIMEADNWEELTVFYDKTRKIIQKSYLSFQSKNDLKQQILIQEKLYGQEYGLDVINNLKRKHVTTFIKRKISMRAGETDVAITEKNPELKEFGAKLAKKVNHVANLDVDLFWTNKGYSVLEMNPRFGGGYPFSHLAGANLPAAIVSWLKNEEADPAWFTLTPDIIGLKGIVPLKMTKSLINFI